MKDILFFRDCRYDNKLDWESIIYGLLLWILIAAVGLGVFFAVDYLPGHESDAKGVVTDHYFTPAHTSLIVHSNGKNTWTQVIYIPDQWDIGVMVNKYYNMNYSVTKSDWNQLKKGDSVNCTLITGLITGSIYSGHLT